MTPHQVAILLLVTVTTTTGSASALAHFRINDSLFAGIGQFEVGDGESRTIVHGKTIKTYRICVHKANDPVVLNVTVDDTIAPLHPGSCADFEGKNISVSPSAGLRGNAILLGRYHRVPATLDEN